MAVTQNYQINAEDKPVIAVAAIKATSYQFYNKDKAADHTLDKVTTNVPINLGINSNATTYTIKVSGSSTVVN